MDDGIHGNFWIGLHQAGEKIRDREDKMGRRVPTSLPKEQPDRYANRAGTVRIVLTTAWTSLCSNVAWELGSSIK